MNRSGYELTPEVGHPSRGFMKKFETEFKLEVVKSFLAGDGGAKLLARRWSVSESMIRTWVSHYRVHGIDGLRPKRSAYSTQFKQQVLSHQDREKLSSRQVAVLYDIRNPNQVVVWRRNLDQDEMLSLRSGKEEHPNMNQERRCAVPSSIAASDPTQALREENERLRAEVAHLKVRPDQPEDHPSMRVSSQIGVA
jgi:transposase